MSKSNRANQAARSMRMGLQLEAPLPAWTPLEAATPVPPTCAQVNALAANAGIPPEQIRRAMHQDTSKGRWFQNSRYSVIVYLEQRHDGLGGVWHLSIRRLDRKPVGPERFRDFQRIKNELLGPEVEAAEIYPAESRLADTANQYHIYAHDDGRSFQFGMLGRAVTDHVPGMPFVQRPLSDP